MIALNKEPLVKMVNITKRFSDVVANDSVDFELYESEIHALLGENGAGKSTLMNILYGLYHPDSGDIYFKDKKVNIRNPLEAQQLGIGMVHQHFMLIPTFTVLENLQVSGRGPFRLKPEEMIEKIKRISSELGITVDIDRKVHELSVGAKQRVEILRLIMNRAKILILDEPTSTLTPQEVVGLFNNLKKLRENGNSIVLITHKMYEVYEVADRVTVLRKGRVVLKSLKVKVQPKDLADAMLGQQREVKPHDRPEVSNPALMRLESLTVLDDEGEEAVRNANLHVAGGEIVGVAGVAGNGQKELVEAIYGLRPSLSGKIFLGVNDITRAKIRDRIENGLGYIPEDRKIRGVALDLSLDLNSIATDHWSKPIINYNFIDYQKVKEFASKIISTFGVITRSNQSKASTLSGGNLQKFIVGRELIKEPKFIIAENPTAGLDVGATEYVRQTLISYRNRGRAILVVSNDLDELLELCDKIVVMYKGRLTAPIPRGKFDKLEIGSLMLGKEAETA